MRIVMRLIDSGERLAMPDGMLGRKHMFGVILWYIPSCWFSCQFCMFQELFADISHFGSLDSRSGH